ncbi:hypothetical protein [Acidovorax sp. ST3]|uniref:hypothetical protein n=1 Tax=Acidovorax sp. ST3 TaxID=2219062 RepID=UPI00193DD208|nr:hypothetical protein [Acidovorax sp. ST3]
MKTNAESHQRHKASNVKPRVKVNNLKLRFYPKIYHLSRFAFAHTLRSPHHRKTPKKV